MTRTFAVLLTIALLAGGGAKGWAAGDGIRDAESATHGFFFYD